MIAGKFVLAPYAERPLRQRPYGGESPPLTPRQIDAYLTDCRTLTVAEIERLVPRTGRYREILYELVLDYPLRAAKALRPALCIASCRSLGGSLEAVLQSAAVLELYHNAFLIHDDVEDASEIRRDRPTLHGTYGAPIAINVGDAMLALALGPLLDNTRLIGLGRALRILETVARMARESTEGQAIELHWIRENCWDLGDADYLRMVYKKTSWYTFVAPILVGAWAAGVDPRRLGPLRKFASLLGIAFQIQDDVLNLVAEEARYGKEIAGDLWEGKHTLILLHAMRRASPADRACARSILAKGRPRPTDLRPGEDVAAALGALLADLERSGDVTATARRTIAERCAAISPANEESVKTPAEIAFLKALIDRHGSIAHAREVAETFARRAQRALDDATWLEPGVHRDFLAGLVGFVTDRDR